MSNINKSMALMKPSFSIPNRIKIPKQPPMLSSSLNPNTLLKKLGVYRLQISAFVVKCSAQISKLYEVYMFAINYSTLMAFAHIPYST